MKKYNEIMENMSAIDWWLETVGVLDSVIVFTIYLLISMRTIAWEIPL